MKDMINPETAKLGTGVSLERGLVVVDIIQSIFNGKMAEILSGSGSASCQMCTATHKHLKDNVLVVDGLPINKTITVRESSCQILKIQIPSLQIPKLNVSA